MLPSDLAEKLPEGIDPERVSACVTIHAGISSSSGETHLLVHDGRMVAISRTSSVFPFQRHELDPDALPRIASRYGQQRLFLRTRDGIEHWLQLADIDREGALAALGELYLGCEAWGPLAEALKVEIELETDEASKISLRCRLAKLMATKLDDSAGSVGIYEDILLYRPGHPEAVDALTEIFIAGVSRAACRKLLEPAYEATGRWEDLIAMIRILLTDEVEDPHERRELLMRIIGLCVERLDSPGRAMDVCGEVLMARPGDLVAREKLEELAEREGDWARAVRILREVIPLATGPGDARILWTRLADILEVQIGDNAGAEEAWFKVLDFDPTATEAYEALRRIFTSQRRWQEKATIYTRELEHCDDEARVIELTMMLGRMREDRLQEVDDAIGCFEKVVELDPHHDEANEHLVRLFTTTAAWSRLFDLLSARADIERDPDEKVEQLLQIADLAFHKLSKPSAAIDIWYQVLDLRRNDKGALTGLSGALDAAGRWLDLVEVLEDLVDVTQVTSEKVGIIKKLGVLWQTSLHNDGRALEWWRKAMDLDPADVEVLQAVKTIAERQKDDKALTSALSRLIPLLPKESRLDPLVQYAKALQRLGQEPKAIEIWADVLEVEPGHTDALDTLEALYTENKRWKEVTDILTARLDLAQDAPTRLSLWLRLGDLHHERLEDDTSAIAAYREVLAISPHHEGAFERLDKLLEVNQRWDALVELLKNRQEILDDAAERVAMARRAAEITREQLRRPDRTFAILLSALADGWRDEALVDDLSELANQTGEWKALADALLGLTSKALSDDDREGLQEALDAALCPSTSQSRRRDGFEVCRHIAISTQRDDPRHAIKWYREMLQLKPKSVEAWTALSRLLRETKQWRQMADHLSKMVEVEAKGIGDRAKLYNELAWVYENHLDNPEAAAEMRRKGEEVGAQSLRLLYFMLFALVILGAAVGAVVFLGGAQ